MSKRIPAKLLKAYFIVAEHMNEDPQMVETKHYFHRTKKYAFFVGAGRLNKDGWLPGEKSRSPPSSYLGPGASATQGSRPFLFPL
jgi:hypothetical protein